MTDRMIPISMAEANKLAREPEHNLAMKMDSHGWSFDADKCPWAIEVVARWRGVEPEEVLNGKIS